MEAISKGAKKANSRLASTSEPLTIGYFHLASRSKLRYVTQVQIEEPLNDLRSDYLRLICGLAVIELLERATTWDSSNEMEFDITIQGLKFVDSEPDPVNALLWFLSVFIQTSGYHSDLSTFSDVNEPISGDSVWFAPEEGGAVSEHLVAAYPGGFRVPTTVLITIARLSERDRPPTTIKLRDETLSTLLKMWTRFLESQLPALQAVQEAIDTDRRKVTKV